MNFSFSDVKASIDKQHIFESKDDLRKVDNFVVDEEASENAPEDSGYVSDEREKIINESSLYQS